MKTSSSAKNASTSRGRRRLLPKVSCISQNFSNNNSENDAIISRRIFDLIPSNNLLRYCVAIGAKEGRQASCTQCLLIPSAKDDNSLVRWFGVLIEADDCLFAQLERLHKSRGNRCLNVAVSTSGEPGTENLVAILQQYAPELPEDFDLLCVDAGGSDYWILNDMWRIGRYFPKVICVAFNGAIPSDHSYVPKRDDGTQHRASLASFIEISKQNGYELITTSKQKAFFAQHHICKENLISQAPEELTDTMLLTTPPATLFVNEYLYDSTHQSSVSKAARNQHFHSPLVCPSKRMSHKNPLSSDFPRGHKSNLLKPAEALSPVVTGRQPHPQDYSKRRQDLFTDPFDPSTKRGNFPTSRYDLLAAKQGHDTNNKDTCEFSRVKIYNRGNRGRPRSRRSEASPPAESLRKRCDPPDSRDEAPALLSPVDLVSIGLLPTLSDPPASEVDSYATDQRMANNKSRTGATLKFPETSERDAVVLSPGAREYNKIDNNSPDDMTDNFQGLFPPDPVGDMRKLSDYSSCLDQESAEAERAEEEHSVSKTERAQQQKPFESIPKRTFAPEAFVKNLAIDMSPHCIWKRSRESEKRSCANALTKELCSKGFAMVRGTGMSRFQCIDALNAVNSFLHEADESVRRSCMTENRNQRGYSPMCTESSRSEYPKDMVQKFRMGSDDRRTKGPTTDQLENSWPDSGLWDTEASEYFRGSLQDYYDFLLHSVLCIVNSIYESILETHPELKQSIGTVVEKGICRNESNLTVLGCRRGSRHIAQKPLMAPFKDDSVITVVMMDGGDCALFQLEDEAGVWRDATFPCRIPDDPIFLVYTGSSYREIRTDLLDSKACRIIPASGVKPLNCLMLSVRLDISSRMQNHGRLPVSEGATLQTARYGSPRRPSPGCSPVEYERESDSRETDHLQDRDGVSETRNDLHSEESFLFPSKIQNSQPGSSATSECKPEYMEHDKNIDFSWYDPTLFNGLDPSQRSRLIDQIVKLEQWRFNRSTDSFLGITDCPAKLHGVAGPSVRAQRSPPLTPKARMHISKSKYLRECNQATIAGKACLSSSHLSSKGIGASYAECSSFSGYQNVPKPLSAFAQWHRKMSSGDVAGELFDSNPPQLVSGRARGNHLEAFGLGSEKDLSLKEKQFPQRISSLRQVRNIISERSTSRKLSSLQIDSKLMIENDSHHILGSPRHPIEVDEISDLGSNLAPSSPSLRVSSASARIPLSQPSQVQSTLPDFLTRHECSRQIANGPENSDAFVGSSQAEDETEAFSVRADESFTSSRKKNARGGSNAWKLDCKPKLEVEPRKEEFGKASTNNRWGGPIGSNDKSSFRPKGGNYLFYDTRSANYDLDPSPLENPDLNRSDEKMDSLLRYTTTVRTSIGSTRNQGIRRSVSADSCMNEPNDESNIPRNTPKVRGGIDNSVGSACDQTIQLSVSADSLMNQSDDKFGWASTSTPNAKRGSVKASWGSSWESSHEPELQLSTTSDSWKDRPDGGVDCASRSTRKVKGGTGKASWDSSWESSHDYGLRASVSTHAKMNKSDEAVYRASRPTPKAKRGKKTKEEWGSSWESSHDYEMRRSVSSDSWFSSSSDKYKTRSKQNHAAFIGKKQRHERYCRPDPSHTRVRSPVLVYEHRALIDNSDSLSTEATPSILASHGSKNFSLDPEGTVMLTGDTDEQKDQGRPYFERQLNVDNFPSTELKLSMSDAEKEIIEAVARTESELAMVQAITSYQAEASMPIECDRYAHFEQQNSDNEKGEASSPPKELPNLPSAVPSRNTRHGSFELNNCVEEESDKSQRKATSSLPHGWTKKGDLPYNLIQENMALESKTGEIQSPQTRNGIRLQYDVITNEEWTKRENASDTTLSERCQTDTGLSRDSQTYPRVEAEGEKLQKLREATSYNSSAFAVASGDDSGVEFTRHRFAGGKDIPLCFSEANEKMLQRRVVEPEGRMQIGAVSSFLAYEVASCQQMICVDRTKNQPRSKDQDDISITSRHGQGPEVESREESEAGGDPESEKDSACSSYHLNKGGGADFEEARKHMIIASPTGVEINNSWKGDGAISLSSISELTDELRANWCR